MQPTQKQIKKVWEWCGLCMHELRSKDELDFNSFKLPDGRQLWNSGHYLYCVKCGYASNSCFIVPELDLNNLFWWVVPRLVDTIGKHKAYLLLSGCLSSAILTGKELELGIFWAVQQVMEEEK